MCCNSLLSSGRKHDRGEIDCWTGRLVLQVNLRWRGHWFRNDFVCIPLCWSLNHCSSWISSDIEVGLAKEDHRAAVVHLGRMVCTEDVSGRPKGFKLRLSDFDASLLCSLTPPHWGLDVHTHAKDLQNSIVEELWDYRDREKSRAKRAIMSDFHGSWFWTKGNVGIYCMIVPGFSVELSLKHGSLVGDTLAMTALLMPLPV